MTDESRPDLALPDEPARFRLTIKRNCSITPRQMLLLLGVTAALSFGIGIGFAVFGAWVVLPFAGLEMLALTAAFHCAGRHAGDYEKFAVTGGMLRVEIRDGGTVHAHEFNPHWATLLVRAHGRDTRLALRSHGHELEVGRHLPADARRGLAELLETQLSSHQKG